MSTVSVNNIVTITSISKACFDYFANKENFELAIIDDFAGNVKLVSKIDYGV